VYAYLLKTATAQYSQYNTRIYPTRTFPTTAGHSLDDFLYLQLLRMVWFSNMHSSQLPDGAKTLEWA
jgi:hypothetical protein